LAFLLSMLSGLIRLRNATTFDQSPMGSPALERCENT
jgi:hypothetical protein